MTDAFRSVGSLFLIVATVSLLALNGCDNPGAIGDNISESEADVAVDTLMVGEMSTSGYEWYSGDFQFFSAGAFSDPLFGDISATGMIKPALPSGSDSVRADAAIKLRLILDGSETYGDSLAPQSFDIYEIQELWRGRAFMLQDELVLGENPIGSFDISGEDSMDVELSEEWGDIYRRYAESDAENDSTYRYERFGMALVPSNSNKIIGLNSQSTGLVVEHPADSFTVDASEWAYRLERSNVPEVPEHSVPVHSTLENVITADLNLSGDDVPSVGISRAELVLYENREAMGAVNRTITDNALLYMTNPEGVPESIGLGNPIARGSYSAEDGSFRFDITAMVQSIAVNGMPENDQFYITLPNSGLVKSSLIYSNGAPADRAPKIIITSIKSSDS